MRIVRYVSRLYIEIFSRNLIKKMVHLPSVKLHKTATQPKIRKISFISRFYFNNFKIDYVETEQRYQSVELC